MGLLNGGSVLSPDSALNNSGYRDTQAYACAITSSLEYSFDNIEALKGLKLTVFGGFDFLLESSDNYLTAINYINSTVLKWKFLLRLQKE